MKKNKVKEDKRWPQTKKVIIVEGGDDKTFIQELIKKIYKIEKEQIETELGISFLIAGTNNTFLKNEAYKGWLIDFFRTDFFKIALAFDLDVNPFNESIKLLEEEILNDSNLIDKVIVLPTEPYQISSSGIGICPIYYQDITKGCLEELCIHLIQEQNTELYNFGVDFISKAESLSMNNSKNWKDKYKKQLASMLITNKDLRFCSTPGIAVEKRLVKLDSQILNTLKIFLQEFTK
jgi:hypothetical protein